MSFLRSSAFRTNYVSHFLSLKPNWFVEQVLGNKNFFIQALDLGGILVLVVSVGFYQRKLWTWFAIVNTRPWRCELRKVIDVIRPILTVWNYSQSIPQLLSYFCFMWVRVWGLFPFPGKTVDTLMMALPARTFGLNNGLKFSFVPLGTQTVTRKLSSKNVSMWEKISTFCWNQVAYITDSELLILLSTSVFFSECSAPLCWFSYYIS